MQRLVVALCRTECAHREAPWRGADDLELATLSWVHQFNTARLHSSIDYVRPVEYQTEYYRHNHTEHQRLPGELSLY